MNFAATFTIAPDGKIITCHLCGLTSHNTRDVQEKYCGHCKVFHLDVLTMFTIFYNPTDYPGQWIVRRFLITRGDVLPDRHSTGFALDLDAARSLIPLGLVRLDRSPQDHASVVETWI